jgi:uncharacterized protein YhdP
LNSSEPHSIDSNAPESTPPQAAGRWIRWLAILVTAFVCVLAVIQVSGRLAFHFVDLLGPQINQSLIPLRTQVIGPVGDWRGFNPILRAQRVAFPAGNLVDVYVELDFFRSVMSGSWVFRRFYSQSGELGIVHTDAGWQLKDSQEQRLNIDLQQIIQSSEFIDASIAVVAERAGQRFQYEVSVGLESRGRVLQGQLSVLSPVAEAQRQQLTMRYHQELPPESDQNRDQRQVQRRLEAQGLLVVPAGLLGDGGMILDVSEGRWRSNGVAGNGQSTGQGRVLASLHLTDSPFLQAGKTASVRADVALIDDREFLLAELQATLESDAAAPLELPLLFLEISRAGLFGQSLADAVLLEGSSLARVRVVNLALGPITDFANAVFSSNEVVGEWIKGLSAKADVEQLIARYDDVVGLEFWAQANGVSLSAHRGSPSITNSQAEIFGDLQQMSLRVSGEAVTMQFPDLFADAWDFDSVQGDLMLLFRPGYASVRGTNIRAVSGTSRINGGFATSRPQARYEQRVSVNLQVDKMDVLAARQYIPYKLDDGLRRWLTQAPLSGNFKSMAAAHHGQIHVPVGDTTSRRFELVADFSDTMVRYKDDWPTLNAGAGSLHVAGRHTYAKLSQGETGGLLIGGADLHADADKGMLFLGLERASQASSALNFVRNSPLQESLRFVTPEWNARGDINIAAMLQIPLVGDLTNDSRLQIDLETEFKSVDFDMPNYRLVWRELSGQHRFSLPHNLQGGVSGKLFDQPVTVNMSHDVEHIIFQLTGSLSAEDVLRVAALPQTTLLTGQADVDALLEVAMDGPLAVRLQLETDLVGMAVALPGEFGKAPGTRSPSTFELAFFGEYQRASWQYAGTQGWMLMPDGEALTIAQGALGIHAEPLPVATDYSGVLVNGNLAVLNLADWVLDGGDPVVNLPFDWQIRELEIGEFVVNDLRFPNVQLNSQGNAESVFFELRSPDLAGSVDLSNSDSLDINLLTLRLPGSAASNNGLEGNLDPVDVSVGRALPRATVFINELFIDQDPFGRWQFDVTPQEDGVRFDLQDVQVNGLNIVDSAVFWDLQENRSAFSGTALMSDLAETLPLWGYAPVVTSESASVAGNLSWAGSPANLEAFRSEGELSIKANDGRFLEVDAGAAGLRAVSLFNITALTKRISLDFSDVVGGGISFEEAYADIQLEDQTMRFTKNLIIKSTSSRYELGGEVDLRSNLLDAQMIVTLPVSDSLPWYAAYLTFFNPLAGIGVAVGERVFRKPIERMSSAKFSITGSLEEPDVVFTELFNQDIEVTDSAGERLSPDLLKSQKISGEAVSPAP